MIDTIKVNESLHRMKKREGEIARGERAAKVLLWMKDYALGREPGDAMFLQTKLQATCTVNADIADAYLEEVAQQFVPAIIEAAVKKAQAELRAADEVYR